MKLIFTRSASFAGHLIRAFEGGDWDHVGIIDGDQVIEATAAHGVRSRRLDSLRADRPCNEIVEFAGPSEVQALAWARAQVGKRYDWSAIAGFVLWRGSWARPDRWYCSELAALTAILAGKRLAGRQRRIGVRMLYALAHAWRG